MIKKGITYVLVFLLFYTLAFILSIVLTGLNINMVLSSGIYIVIFLLQIAVLALVRKHILKRVIMKEGAGYLVFPISLMITATMVIAAIGRNSGNALLPEWTSYLGVVLVFVGYFVAISSFNSSPPHAALRYMEAESGEGYGPYDVIRCPVELAAILLTISIPLYFGSVYAFIPAGISIVLIIVEAAIKDHWRFVNYEYYYEYTKRVSYVLFPLIW